MLIVCWNVAGLSTTVSRIHESYSNDTKGVKRDAKGNAVLRDYFQRHQADIICLQEHKIPQAQLSNRSEPFGCANIQGYESYWSCCVDPTKKGLNGVVTYVKNGVVPVYLADSRPLGSPDLDDQGRCLMTDHGNFVLFNVYVPANSGQPLSYKMKFLNALRRAMTKQRVQHGKQVILVGDLNISHQPIDRFWSDRALFVDDICRQVAQLGDPASQEEGDIPKWKQDLAKAWPRIQSVLETQKVVPTKTTNSLTRQSYDKYRMTVQVDGNTVFLGSHESHPGYCEYQYSFDSWSYVCTETGEQVQAVEQNVISISTVSELMQKIAGVEWPESLQRDIADTDGRVSELSPPRRWLTSVLQEDGMIDTFRFFHPSAEGRFTCWNQFTNRRYVNEGARIDFALVDGSLAGVLQRGNVKHLRCGCGCPERHLDADGEVICAVTANGGFRPVSFEGGGIIEASRSVLDSQFGQPHTGIIYTPPSFSDHVAISLLLDNKSITGLEQISSNLQHVTTRKAQPHKMQQSITSFFGKASSSSVSMSLPKKAPSKLEVAKPKRKIQDFWQPKPSSSISGAPRTTQVRAVKPQRPTKVARPSGTLLDHYLPKNPSPPNT
eukprot:Nitzschia sp. Nitz4//scaffold48_size128905//89384//91204//NITZ4_003611-RA/size128905-processed-gene-0.120-mRNA-1//-1//CDS//3329553015//4193//frame0